MKTKKAILWLIVLALLAGPMLACAAGVDTSSSSASTTIRDVVVLPEQTFIPATATPSTTDIWKEILAKKRPCPKNWWDPDLVLPAWCDGTTTPAPTRPAGN